MEKTLVKTAPHQVGLSLYLDVLNFSWFSFVLPKQASLDPINVRLCCQASCYERPSCFIISDMLLLATVTALGSLMSHSSGSTYVFELVKTSMLNTHDYCYSNWKTLVSSARLRPNENKILQHVVTTGVGESLLITQRKYEMANGKGWHRLENWILKETPFLQGSFGFAVIQ